MPVQGAGAGALVLGGGGGGAAAAPAGSRQLSSSSSSSGGRDLSDSQPQVFWNCPGGGVGVRAPVATFSNGTTDADPLHGGWEGYAMDEVVPGGAVVRV